MASAAQIKSLLLLNSVMSAPLISPARSGHFEQTCCAHAATDAHRDNNPFRAAALPLDQCMADEAASGHPKRVADGDRAAVDVHEFGRDAEPIAAIKGLGSERFIELPQIDVVDL